jgi:hypothetical protein
MVSNLSVSGWQTKDLAWLDEILLKRQTESCSDQAALAGARRPTQCIGRPRQSFRGSTPKVLRRSHLQLDRRGCGRCCWFNSTKIAAHNRALQRGESSPKYRIACRPRSGTCCIRMLTNSSFVYRFRTNCLFFVSFAKYSTSPFSALLRRCWAIGVVVCTCHRGLAGTLLTRSD